MSHRTKLVLVVMGLAAFAAPTNGQSLAAAELRASILAPGGDFGFAAPAAGAEPVRRSVPVAFGLSALVPGAGQAYNRQWKKAVTALGLEAVVFTVWSITRSKGLDAEDDFRAFAHANWSPARYSVWLNDYVAFLESEYSHAVTAPQAAAPAVDFSNPGAWTSVDRQAVAAFFAQIQAIERQVFHPETGATFSHQLPGFGEQQYYELIGKYFQFAPGWDDYPEWVGTDGVFTEAIDPERTGAGGSKPNVSDTFYDYARDHAHAQDLLRTASRLSTLFVVNHLIAGIDAAVTAKLRNDRIDASLQLVFVPQGPPAPMLSVRVGL